LRPNYSEPHFQILLARCLFFGQRAVTLYVELRSALHRYGIGKQRLGLCQLPFRLVQRGLKRPRVNLKQQLPLLDEGAFLVGLLHEVARDLRPHIGVRKPVERPDPLAINRNIPLLHLNDFNIRGSTALRAGNVLRPHRSYHHSNHHQANRPAYPKFVF